MSSFVSPRRLLAAASVAVLALVALPACSSSTSVTKVSEVGQVLPAGKRKAAGTVDGTLLTGAKASLAAYRGHVVVVPFWANWCEPCSVEIPQLSLYYEQVRASGVDVLGVNTHNPGKNARSSPGNTFVSDHKIVFPNLYDPDGAILLKLAAAAARSLPATVLIDKQGRVAAVYSDPVTVKDLTPAVQKLSAEKS